MILYVGNVDVVFFRCNMKLLLNPRSFALIAVFTFCSGLFISTPLFSQTDEVLVELADDIYDFGDYEDALDIYLQAIEENNENVRAHLMAGECYLRTTSDKDKASGHFLRAYELNPEVTNKILFKIGEGYRFGFQFDNAIEYYKKFITELEVNRRMFSGDNINQLKELSKRRIFECENAKEYVDNPVDKKIINLGGKINSEYEDYAPTISNDEKTIYFTSRRPGGTGRLKDIDNKYYEDIWVSHFEDGEWQEAENLGPPINTETHESNLGLSPDGNRLYIYHTENNGDVFYSDRDGDGWSKPKPFKHVNTEYRETSIHFTRDGKRMFFASERPDGYGGTDIYYCDHIKKDKWSEPKLLGKEINTKYDEDGPVYDTEHDILYFSSKGHKGMGGYDLFQSKYDPETDTFGKPENLGFPINSPDDDLYFNINTSGDKAYFASFKNDSYGKVDLYVIYIEGGEDIEEEPEKTQAAERTPVQFNLSVVDATTDERIPAQVKLVRKSDNTSLAEERITASDTFQYVFEDTVHTSYIISLEADDFLFQTVTLQMPAMTADDQVIERSIAMRKPETKRVNVLKNIYFAFDKHTIESSSHTELNLLKTFMDENPEKKIEIAGHTDFIGPPAYNDQLSQQRANAVRDYLIQNGISKDRIVAKGYGEKHPIVSNDDEEEGREFNRRTEFIILN